MERLQKYIAECGYTSRRRAEELIKDGKVKINGKVVDQLGTKVSGKELIEVDGKIIKREEKEYYLLNKPRQTITSVTDDKNRKTVVELIDTSSRIYPVGRLDYDTSGLLLLTNDGELTNLLIHPKYKIPKVYIAKIENIVIKDILHKLLKGVMIENTKTKADKVRIKKIDKRKKTSIVEITIHEGKYHQVKKMFEAIGYNVIGLKREKFAFLDLKGLTSGEYRHLNIKEVKKLYNLVK